MVLPGFSPTLAKFLRFKMRLITEDLPTLDLPAKAISGIFFFGKSLGDAAEIKNSTFCKFIATSLPNIRPTGCAFDFLGDIEDLGHHFLRTAV